MSQVPLISKAFFIFLIIFLFCNIRPFTCAFPRQKSSKTWEKNKDFWTEYFQLKNSDHLHVVLFSLSLSMKMGYFLRNLRDSIYTRCIPYFPYLAIPLGAFITQGLELIRAGLNRGGRGYHKLHLILRHVTVVITIL